MNWQSERVFHDGDSFFREVLNAVSDANKSVHLEYYIFNDGILARRLVETVCLAASRGVKVVLCIDGLGSIGFPRELRTKLVDAGVEVRVYNPLGHFFPFSAKFWRQFSLINRRNHRKVCLVDGRQLFVGGMNIDDWHLPEVKKAEAWRDTGVRVTAEDMNPLEKNLEQIWRPRKTRSKDEINLPVLLNDGLARRRKFYRKFISRIRHAEKRIWITSPYFSPPGRFLVSLINAARRGVDTRILLPARPDIFFSRPMNGLFFSVLLSSGVKIYEYMSSTLHAKSIIIDDWVAVGSSNKNYRSFFYDLEIDVILTQRTSLIEMETQFERDLKESREITIKDWNMRPWLWRLVEKFLWLVRRWA